jgi:hypothetical protein
VAESTGLFLGLHNDGDGGVGEVFKHGDCVSTSGLRSGKKAEIGWAGELGKDGAIAITRGRGYPEW